MTKNIGRTHNRHLEVLNGNYLRDYYFHFWRSDDCKGKLPFPAHEVQVGEDKCLVYDIPKERMQEALDMANPLKGIIQFPVNRKRRVLFSDDDTKYWYFRQAFIIYYKRYNYIVPPTFFKDGATAEGWCIRKD